MVVPFRADQVGSLLRPAALLQARAAHAEGRLGAEELRRAEDQAILDALEMQRQAGVDVFSDGEYRRAGWMSDMPDAVEGFVSGGYTLEMRSKGPSTTASASTVVAARLRQTRRLTAHEIAFLKAHAPGPFKITMPSPTNFAYLCFQPGLTDRFYASRSELLDELVGIVRDELRAAADDGVPYVQLDAPRYTLHVDPRTRAQLADLGIRPDEALDESIKADNGCLEGLRRDGLTVAMHVCRGNAAGGGWFAEGGYERIAEQLFGTIQVDRLLLEFDSERAGGFEPLRFVPKGKTVVLGLITTKEARLESIDDLLRRIDEASKYVPVENLAISPQCGFASVAPGNPISPDDQRRKLELVADVAGRVWGGSPR